MLFVRPSFMWSQIFASEVRYITGGAGCLVFGAEMRRMEPDVTSTPLQPGEESEALEISSCHQHSQGQAGNLPSFPCPPLAVTECLDGVWSCPLSPPRDNHYPRVCLNLALKAAGWKRALAFPFHLHVGSPKGGQARAAATQLQHPER